MTDQDRVTHMIMSDNNTQIVTWSQVSPSEIISASRSIVAILHKRFKFIFWSQDKSMLKLILVVIVFILQASTQVPPCSAIPHPNTDELTFVQNSRPLIQQRDSHSNLVSGGSLPPSNSLARKDNVVATIDDQDQSTYQKVAVGRSVTFKW